MPTLANMYCKVGQLVLVWDGYWENPVPVLGTIIKVEDSTEYEGDDLKLYYIHWSDGEEDMVTGYGIVSLVSNLERELNGYYR